MLGALKSLVKNTRKLDENRFVNSALSNSQIQYDILELNRQDQLYEQGITADGKSMGDYAPFTLRYKIEEAGKMGRDTRTDHITLKDTGEFYSTFRFKKGKDEFIIAADTIKDGTDLIEREGNILGLTNENKAVVAGWIKPDIISQTRKVLQG